MAGLLCCLVVVVICAFVLSQSGDGLQLILKVSLGQDFLGTGRRELSVVVGTNSLQSGIRCISLRQHF